MIRKPGLPVLALATLLVTACATNVPETTTPLPAERPAFSLSPQMQDRILALDPQQVTQSDVKEILARGPAPRIVNIHGGIYPVHLVMKSFSEFLVGMGYPENSVRLPGDGSYSFSCYDSSEKIAGSIAWFYEHEGMRPMLVGHSQGGIQAVKVLHELAGNFETRVPVWNPLTRQKEARYEITEPLSGNPLPVVGLKVSYATAIGAGGLTRVLPNQWKMMRRLRHVPDSVVEFTGFYMGMDLLGGDLLGFGSGNLYEANGTAHVRNVQLPTGSNHFNVPATRHLLDSQEIIDWIYNYTPSEKPTLDTEFSSDSRHILWAADVWYSIRKHWVLELQRVIGAQRSQDYGN